MSKELDQILGLEAVSKSNPTPAGLVDLEAVKKKKSHHAFSSNYIMAVMKLTDLAMQRQGNIVKLQGELADVAGKMQGDFAVINQFLSMLEDHAHSGGILHCYHDDMTSPDDASGLSRDFYYVDDDDWENGHALADNYGSDLKGFVSSSYQSGMQGFVNAFKDLFFASGASTGQITVADLSKIVGPNGETFNLGPSSSGQGGFWSNTAAEFNEKFNFLPSGASIISTIPGMHPSLVQQYIYYSAQLSVYSCSKEDLKSAAGDITKVPGVNFDPTSGGFDPTLNSVMQFLTAMNVSPQYNAVSIYNYGESLIDLVWNGQFYNTYNGQTEWNNFNNGYVSKGDGAQGKVMVGLYMAFSIAAYNYFWTKNPNASQSTDDGNSSASQCVKNQGPTDTTGTQWWDDWGIPSYYTQWCAGWGPATPSTDELSSMYMTASSAQATLSSLGSSTNTSFQQDTSSVQTINTSAQQMIGNYGQFVSSMVQAFKG